MMLYPPMAELAAKTGSRYLLVNLVARRAREISAELEESGESSEEKPVSEAINEVYADKLIAVEREGDPEDETAEYNGNTEE